MIQCKECGHWHGNSVRVHESPVVQYTNFNTGRGYTSAGQIIDIIAIKSGETDTGGALVDIYFSDTSRGITGKFSHQGFFKFPTRDTVLQGRLLTLYDKGGYEGVSTREFARLIDTYA